MKSFSVENCRNRLMLVSADELILKEKEGLEEHFVGRHDTFKKKIDKKEKVGTEIHVERGHW